MSFKKQEVVMLSTDQKASLDQNVLLLKKSNGELVYGKLIKYSTSQTPSTVRQHLYSVEDYGVPIHSGDWFLHDTRFYASENSEGTPVWELDYCIDRGADYLIGQKHAGLKKNIDWCRKVTATTRKNVKFGKDPLRKIELPNLRASFCKMYELKFNKGEQIKFVNAVTNEDGSLYVDPDGELVLRKWLPKQYSPEEVYEIIREFSSQKTREFTSNDVKWAKHKLNL
jgi:hypothetical protein